MRDTYPEFTFAGKSARRTAASIGLLLMVGVMAGCDAASSATAPPPALPTPEGVQVLRVIDGDTFETADGQTIRVLGIDSCETETNGGQAATSDARIALEFKTVTLTTQPGVDRDSFGRQLRYVRTATGLDFGQSMVAALHTGVYEGPTGPSPGYLDGLRRLDAGQVRMCEPISTTTTSTTTTTPPTTASPVVAATDDNDDTDVRSYSSSGSGTKARTGNSGHPCLPGERDGDGDGYCGEGR